MAVDLAKMSLWLVTLAKDHALTFVDHALRHGDSLVGLSRKQIEAFHWDPDAPRFQAGFETMRVREHVAKVAELRRRIREADESVSDCRAARPLGRGAVRAWQGTTFRGPSDRGVLRGGEAEGTRGASEASTRSWS